MKCPACRLASWRLSENARNLRASASRSVVSAQGPHDGLRQHRDRARPALGAEARDPGELRLARCSRSWSCRPGRSAGSRRTPPVTPSSVMVPKESTRTGSRQPGSARLVELAGAAGLDDPVLGNQLEQRGVVRSSGQSVSVMQQQPGRLGVLAGSAVKDPRGEHAHRRCSRLTTRNSWPHSRQKASGNSGCPAGPSGALRWYWVVR